MARPSGAVCGRHPEAVPVGNPRGAATGLPVSPAGVPRGGRDGPAVRRRDRLHQPGRRPAGGNHKDHRHPTVSPPVGPRHRSSAVTLPAPPGRTGRPAPPAQPPSTPSRGPVQGAPDRCRRPGAAVYPARNAPPDGADHRLPGGPRGATARVPHDEAPDSQPSAPLILVGIPHPATWPAGGV